MNQLTVTPLGTGHLAAVARVHEDAFPRSALTRLGPDLVERYYGWLLTGPHDVVALGWFSDGALLGFVVAGRFRRALSGFVNLNRRRLVARILSRPWLVANPLVRERLASGWRWVVRRNLPAVEVEPAKRPSFGILALAVAPAAEGRGGGRALLAAAEAAATERGCRRMHLTVEPDNERAIRFYEQAGWSRELDAGVWTGRMIKDTAPQPRAAGRTSS